MERAAEVVDLNPALYDVITSYSEVMRMTTCTICYSTVDEIDPPIVVVLRFECAESPLSSVVSRKSAPIRARVRLYTLRVQNPMSTDHWIGSPGRAARPPSGRLK